LVVGDLIKIEKGMRIPADCILVKSKDESIVLDQKQLNVGESKFLLDRNLTRDSDYTAVELESALGTNNFSGELPFLLSHTFVK
jgi:magnesium-transporting ATPase (P-type)